MFQKKNKLTTNSFYPDLVPDKNSNQSYRQIAEFSDVKSERFELFTGEGLNSKSQINHLINPKVPCEDNDQNLSVTGLELLRDAFLCIFS